MSVLEHALYDYSRRHTRVPVILSKGTDSNSMNAADTAFGHQKIARLVSKAHASGLVRIVLMPAKAEYPGLGHRI